MCFVPSPYIRYDKENELIVWWQNGDLGLGWVLEYIQRFIVDSGRCDPTDHKSDWWHPVIIEQFFLLAKIQNGRHKNRIFLISQPIFDLETWFLRQTLHYHRHKARNLMETFKLTINHIHFVFLRLISKFKNGHHRNVKFLRTWFWRQILHFQSHESNGTIQSTI